jgi:methyltransferase (TIGR00027 family)
VSLEHASRTAYRVAMRRASHQLLDQPLVFDDPLALRLLRPEHADALRANPDHVDSGPVSSYLRAFFAARSRFAEDQLARLREQGLAQYVVLGAGLDTFACRHPAPQPPLRVFEVDHPATQAFKRERLAAVGIEAPACLTFVPVDFERQRFTDELGKAGFRADQPAFFAWLGVSIYLTAPAVEATLRGIADSTRAGGGVVFDYGLSPKRVGFMERLVLQRMAAKVASIGEPWISFFEPEALVADLHRYGFANAEDFTGQRINALYFAGRRDGLKVGSVARLMWAGARPAPLR